MPCDINEINDTLNEDIFRFIWHHFLFAKQCVPYVFGIYAIGSHTHTHTHTYIYIIKLPESPVYSKLCLPSWQGL